MIRLFINVGRNQRVQAKDILGAIAGEVGIPGKLVGTIDITINILSLKYLSKMLKRY